MKSSNVRTPGEAHRDTLDKVSTPGDVTTDQVERVIGVMEGIGDILESIDARLAEIHRKMPGPNPTPGNGNGGK